MELLLSLEADIPWSRRNSRAQPNWCKLIPFDSEPLPCSNSTEPELSAAAGRYLSVPKRLISRGERRLHAMYFRVCKRVTTHPGGQGNDSVVSFYRELQPCWPVCVWLHVNAEI